MKIVSTLAITVCLLMSAFGGIIALADSGTTDAPSNDGATDLSRDASRSVTSITEVSTGLPNTGSYTTAFFVNLNGDSYLDIAGGMLGAGGARAYTCVGGTSWTNASTGLPTSGSYALGTVGDVNHDNNVDLILPYEDDNYGGGENGLEVWLSNGGAGGTVSWTHGIDPVNTSAFSGVAVGDVNGDGFNDIAASQQTIGATTTSGLRFWLSSGGTGWTEQSTGLPTNLYRYGITLADMNGDNLLDIVTGEKIFTYNAGGSWTDSSGTLPNTLGIYNVRVADVNLDGNKDIIMATSQNGARILTGNGHVGASGVWTSNDTTINAIPGDLEPIAVTNVDQDGRPDLFVASDYMNGGAYIYLNGDSGTSLTWTRAGATALPTGVDFYGGDVGDFNGDGSGDILLGSAFTGLQVFKVISPPPAPPRANAGDDRQIYTNTTVVLNGTRSAAPMGIAAWDWNVTAQPAGSAITLVNETTANASFIPQVPGVYTFTLTVKDTRNNWSSNDARVNITAVPFPNALPVSNAGPDQTVTAGTWVRLNGTHSTDDPTGGIAAYVWNLTAQPDGASTVLANNTTALPDFTPLLVGDYEFSLAVRDINNTWGALEDRVKVKATPRGVSPPVAEAGSEVTVELGTMVVLDGTGSTDDLKVTEYKWSMSAGPPGAVIQLPAAAVTNITLPSVGIYTVQLVVKDNDGFWSEPDTVKITVIPKNLPPEADISKPDDGASFLDTAVLEFDASDSSDPEEGEISYEWTSSIDGLLSDKVSFTTNLSIGKHEIILMVTDDHLLNGTVSIDITINEDKAPLAEMTGAPALILSGGKVEFDASDSTEPDKQTMEYNFKFGDGKDTGWQNGAKATHKYDKVGTFDAFVSVRDPFGHEANSSTVPVRVGVVPTAAFKAGITVCKVGTDCPIDGTGSSDQDGTVASYYFDFGDGTNSGWVDTGNMSHKYTVAGPHMVKLKVKDNDGFESTEMLMSLTIEEESKGGSSGGLAGGSMLPILLLLIIVIVVVAVALMMKRSMGKKSQAAPLPPSPQAYPTQAPSQSYPGQPAPAPAQQPYPPPPPPQQAQQPDLYQYQQQGYAPQDQYQAQQYQHDQGPAQAVPEQQQEYRPAGFETPDQGQQ